MWTAALNFVGAALIVAFVAWLAYSAARHRAFGGIAAALLAVAVALPSVGHALEIRHENGPVTVTADETINDTLLAIGETVSIDGNINGDLVAFGREVTVRGNVTGNVVTGAQSVTIEGTVGGTVLGSGERVTLENRVGRDFYGFGNRVEIASGANVAGNAIAFGGSNIDLGGRVGIDFKAFGGNTVTVSGAVERNVDGGGQTVTVESTARIGGNVTGHVGSTGDLKVEDGALIGGTTSEQLVERGRRRDHNRYLTSGYYLGQVVRLAGLFLTGLALMWLVPVLREVSLPNAMAV
jgi:hypothetical protein